MLFQITKALDEAFPSTKIFSRFCWPTFSFYVTQIIQLCEICQGIMLDDI
jgi:hypothetical protein